ncbi:MAG: hypothetical protein WA705_03260 [Candidatus Ozemobacteraceae bacterium]
MQGKLEEISQKYGKTPLFELADMIEIAYVSQLLFDGQKKDGIIMALQPLHERLALPLDEIFSSKIDANSRKQYKDLLPSICGNTFFELFAGDEIPRALSDWAHKLKLRIQEILNLDTPSDLIDRIDQKLPSGTIRPCFGAGTNCKLGHLTQTETYKEHCVPFCFTPVTSVSECKENSGRKSKRGQQIPGAIEKIS